MSARTLGGMYRQAGLVVLGIGAVLGLTMVFTGFEHAVKSWEVDFDSGDVSQVTVACPAPFGIVFGDAEGQASGSGASAGGRSRRGSRLTPSRRSGILARSPEVREEPGSSAFSIQLRIF